MPERWPALLSRSEAAEYLGVSESTIKRLKAADELHSVVIRGKTIKYRRSDLDRFIEDLPFGDGQFPERNDQVAMESW